jgi:hypothetical protein
MIANTVADLVYVTQVIHKVSVTSLRQHNAAIAGTNTVTHFHVRAIIN